MSEAGFSVRRLLPVGAEIVGLAEDCEADPHARSALYDAWLEHGVLLFRNVDSIERHLAISRCFGELEIHPVPEVRYEENPYLIELGGEKKRTPAYVYDGADIRVNRIPWHRDTAYSPDICKGAMLRMLEVPVHEGETMVADTALAYDELPADVKARLAGLEYKATLRSDPISQTRPGAFWNTVRLATEAEDPEVTIRASRVEGLAARYPSVVHPAVLTHPESGRTCLFLSPTYVDCFLGMEQSGSDALLRYLTDHMLQSKYVYRHKWSVNDALLWDNRRCMHAGFGNLPGEPRHGLRTTLAGPLRTGRYFDPDARPPSLSAHVD